MSQRQSPSNHTQDWITKNINMKVKIIALLMALAVGVYAQTTNVQVAVHTNDAKLYPTNAALSVVIQQGLDKETKSRQKAYILTQFEKATPTQRRALVQYIKDNLP